MGIIIGLTGPTGAGKSSLSAVAARLGIKVIDCDRVARSTSENKQMLNLLCAEFGEDIVKNGVLDRKALAARAFSSPERTEKMNSIMLPFICENIEKQITGECVILYAPTLFESGLDKRCDKIIGVLADVQTRRARIVERDGLSESEASVRLSAAKTDEFFVSRCDYIIYNNGSEADLYAEAEALLRQITEVN